MNTLFEIHKPHIGLIYGGRSEEHEVSLSSAQTIYDKLVALGYPVSCIAITRDGIWYLQKNSFSKTIIQNKQFQLHIIPGSGLWNGSKRIDIDIAFPVTHGTEGEDGRLQGLLELAHIPCAGCDSFSSALGMRKETTKQLCQAAGIPVVPWMVIDKEQLATHLADAAWWNNLSQEIEKKLGKLIIVKPEAGGSSVGVTLLRGIDARSLEPACTEAARYGNRILIESFIDPPVELECGILETEHDIITIGPGVLIDPAANETGFITYEHKYIGSNTARIKVPAPIDDDDVLLIRYYAKKVFTLLRCNGYARVDFFHAPSNPEGQRVLFNEINTLPGMTPSSHYPDMLDYEGISWDMFFKEVFAIAFRQKRF